ncbi:phenylalanine 4-monooxygenase [Chitinimonas sp. BJB300]|uniref:phenylalanine 4-monooxygenase n=1 Tax=Chitinimonas sp. BJB300 TaxID=1559339 RepID=UPI000C0C9E00|nr:phenylalanine 4-monooxygenase [Chitinimonas sp. BJB300]PHV10669.1 phenylalanine 4-monooxygenase [Chitinimonas sp. BJB300]TSJ84491.1 phenylalanine 4-monooxygenase [Chitinimonas sp. BJB300]
METEFVPRGMQECIPDYRDIHQVEVPAYTDIEHHTWAQLYANQQRVLPGRACSEFMEGLAQVEFPSEKIPALAQISDRIKANTGWTLTRVDGLVPNYEFFKLLSERIFPSTDFIRRPDEIEYTPSPDMFHDLLGHAPLLLNPRFCAFFEDFGKAGVAAFENPAVNPAARDWLPRIYWFTVEYGLIQNLDGLRIYGAGILSSPKEVLYSLSDGPKKLPFDLDEIANKTYDIWHMQEELFVIESFDQLEDSFYAWAHNHGLLADRRSENRS